MSLSCAYERVAAIGFAFLLACVQTGSVGSDTGRDTQVDEASGSSFDDAAETWDTEGVDPYAVCEDIDTTGEPFPDSCMPSPADSPCLQCIKLICCSELLSCPSFEACVCQIDCAEMAAPPDVCNEACGGTPGGCDLSGCGELECEQVCAGPG